MGPGRPAQDTQELAIKDTEERCAIVSFSLVIPLSILILQAWLE